MDPASHGLEAIRGTADAGRAIASSGPAWDALIELGVDVTLLLRQLAMSPAERLRRASEHARFAAAVQERTLAAPLRAELERARLWAKIETLGGPDPAWPAELRDGR